MVYVYVYFINFIYYIRVFAFGFHCRICLPFSEHPSSPPRLFKFFISFSFLLYFIECDLFFCPVFSLCLVIWLLSITVWYPATSHVWYSKQLGLLHLNVLQNRWMAIEVKNKFTNDKNYIHLKVKRHLFLFPISSRFF